MKPIILSLLLLIPVSTAFASDSTYQETLRAVHHRFDELEMLGSDYRKAQPRLSPEQEQERLRLHGQLLRDDPIWVLYNQIDADIEALKAVPTKTDSDAALIDTLKNLLAYVHGHNDQATTRAQADEYARALRQFVARRDYEGIKVWSKLHEK
jgi:hypothetical protein